MFRLVAYAPNGVKRFALDRSDMQIGSSDDCDIRLPFAGVAAEHARLELRRGRVQVYDLGSRKGVLVNGERVKRASLQVLDEIRLGSIALLLEEVVQEADEATGQLPQEPPPQPVMTPQRMLEHLAQVSAWVLADRASSTTLESLIIELLLDFGGGVLFLFQGEQMGIKFVVSSEARWLRNGEELLRQTLPLKDDQSMLEATEKGLWQMDGQLDKEDAWLACRTFQALERPYLFVLALPRFRPLDWSPLAALATLADQLILGLVHHVGQYEPILFGGRQQSAELALAPGLVAGESKAMRDALDQLRTAIDQPIHVLLRGEPGVSKELLARSLHLSGRRRDKPFVVAGCRGASNAQVEADLFGAEVSGRSGPLIREGKLLAADGGTLYLEDIEHLPLALQDRLVRFIRSGNVEPADSQRIDTVDVRLVASCRLPLEEEAARDRFRIDLAYRLSQFVVDVPALRARREDLPLLIQATVNRCCHETNKRIQGITVQALEALAVYDYPGNLPELENIVRRLVYLCPSGRPINESMLPEAVRLSKVKGLRPQVSSELNLERLVGDCERAAIREAMQRSHGNKSAAARLLGLSRNGLTMKMQRHGL